MLLLLSSSFSAGWSVAIRRIWLAKNHKLKLKWSSITPLTPGLGVALSLLHCLKKILQYIMWVNAHYCVTDIITHPLINMQKYATE